MMLTKKYCFGRYILIVERIGQTWVYDVSTKSGMPVSCGVDMTSGSEREVVEGIVGRLSKGNPDRGYTVAA
jgi:hypothetical protein